MAKILIIDDSALSRRLLKKILDELNHQVIEATDGLSGIELYSIENPDCVFLDLTMPGMYGIDVLKNILDINNQAKIIIASADIQKTTKELSEISGAKAFINKPFDALEIKETLDKIL
ncbi:MAG: response regulator [Melioribacteraceae bacterium]|nr:response regulator [Melioribacteraceae bacterium]